ncbi:MAG TPA: hypothetical protein VLA60_12005 [Nitrospirales bacterium]|nr:hypothetical protein [Nitrospirales bacterium]
MMTALTPVKRHQATRMNYQPCAMMAPTITNDNFILVDSEGQARRMEVGDSEGHRMPFVVQMIVEHGAMPWYVEFWHWIIG